MSGNTVDRRAETVFTLGMTNTAHHQDIEAGAWTPPSGDPIIEVRECIDGWCVYCGEVIPAKVAVTQGGMTIAAPGHPTMRRWFNDRWEAWHIECFQQWIFHWVVNGNGTIHMTDCRYAEPGPTFQGTRGEARHAFPDYHHFCGRCAPLDRWLAA